MPAAQQVVSACLLVAEDGAKNKVSGVVSVAVPELCNGRTDFFPLYHYPGKESQLGEQPEMLHRRSEVLKQLLTRPLLICVSE
jgi:hypothetical protein